MAEAPRWSGSRPYFRSRNPGAAQVFGKSSEYGLDSAHFVARCCRVKQHPPRWGRSSSHLHRFRHLTAWLGEKSPNAAIFRRSEQLSGNKTKLRALHRRTARLGRCSRAGCVAKGQTIGRPLMGEQALGDRFEQFLSTGFAERVLTFGHTGIQSASPLKRTSFPGAIQATPRF